MGNKLGADFSSVRFHTDAGSAAKADAMVAHTYTAGNDVYFGSGGFEASAAAHELVHTVQQGAVDGVGVSVYKDAKKAHEQRHFGRAAD
ncbi:DUF4157 domain-containing protein [Desulfosporosinus youngiae]|uniref:eCIS core domain-containing protein n=1 Tax=Desulfosporosinus youngiae TaxID=339862 RepID=UPI0002E35622